MIPNDAIREHKGIKLVMQDASTRKQWSLAVYPLAFPGSLEARRSDHPT